MEEKLKEWVARAEAVRNHPWETEHDVVSAVRVHLKELADIVVSVLSEPKTLGSSEPQSEGPATPGQGQTENDEEHSAQV